MPLSEQEIDAILKDYGMRFLNGKIYLAKEPEEVYKLFKREYYASHKDFITRMMKNGVLDIIEKPFVQNLAHFKVVPVDNSNKDLFKFLALVFSISPVRLSFGRNVQYFVWDEANDRPAAVVNMISPTIRMQDRDEFLGVNKDNRTEILNRGLYMNVFNVLYPYTACRRELFKSVFSKEVREIYKKKYENRETLILRRKIDPHLLFVYTVSLLPPYEIPFFKFVGWTKGTGSFHFPSFVKAVLRKRFDPRYENNFFAGSSYDLSVLDNLLGFKVTQHSIVKRIYVAPLVKNLKSAFNGKKPSYIKYAMQDCILNISNFNAVAEKGFFKNAVNEMLEGSLDKIDAVFSL
ncbi:MAG: DUF4338 domain-containing protein [Conexivisphaerales archaeon]